MQEKLYKLDTETEGIDIAEHQLRYSVHPTLLKMFQRRSQFQLGEMYCITPVQNST